MRAIEVQALEHIEQDDDLSQSIKSWKEQWARVNEGVKDKRKKCAVETPPKGSPRRVMV